MHTPATIEQFIQKRAKGASLQLISSEIGVSKTTLVAWSDKYATEIALAQQEVGLERIASAGALFDRQLANVRSAQARLNALIKPGQDELASLPLLQRFRLFFLIQRETIRLHALQLKNDINAAKLLHPSKPRQNPNSHQRSNNGQVSNHDLETPQALGTPGRSGLPCPASPESLNQPKPKHPQAAQVIATPLLPHLLRPIPKIIPPDLLDLLPPAPKTPPPNCLTHLLPGSKPQNFLADK